MMMLFYWILGALAGFSVGVCFKYTRYRQLTDACAIVANENLKLKEDLDMAAQLIEMKISNIMEAEIVTDDNGTKRYKAEWNTSSVTPPADPTKHV